MPATETNQIDIPAWMEEAIPMPAEALEVISSERKSLLEWMEQDYCLSRKVHGLSDRWSRDYGPFWVPVIERIDDSTTREVWGFAPAQSGKSTVGTGWMGYTVDVDPVPMALVMPRDKDAAERMETNIIPMFEENQRLLMHASGHARNINIGKLTMFDNMAFYLLFAGSAAELANKAICRIQADEVGKYPAAAGVEADPMSLMRKRLRTFKGRSKLYAVTTPVLKGDLSDTNWLRGDQCEWFVPCVHCGKWQRPTWKDVVLDKTAEKKLLDAEAYRQGGRARLCCQGCKRPWSEGERWEASLRGKYVPAAGEIDEDGRVTVGGEAYKPSSYFSFRITALVLHPAIMTIDDLAADWAEAIKDQRGGDSGPMQDFINSQLAEVWEERQRVPEETQLVSHIGGYDRGVVPPGVQLLTAAVDVQLDHVWLTIHGWGYQFESWVLYYGRLETGLTEHIENFEIVRNMLAATWPLANDPKTKMRIAKAGIDSGYRTDVVYDICRMWTELPVVPLMGYSEDRMTGRLYRTAKLADGLVRYDLNTDRFKDTVYRLLFVQETPGPGYLHLHKEMPEEFLKQLVAEHQVRKKVGRRHMLVWEKIHNHLDNHFWDLLVYGRFLAEIAGVQGLPDPTEIRPKVPAMGRPIGKRPVRTKY